MLIIFPALLGALTTAKEYETGTIIQAYASSLTAVQWIVGKALLYVLIGAVEFVLCFALGLLVFEFRFPTDPTVLLVATVLYLLSGVFFGMMCGNATQNQSAAIQAVQMGSFSAFAVAFGVHLRSAEYSDSNSLAVQLSTRDLLYSDCPKLHPTRRGMGHFAAGPS
jgi:drug efflux transport system permease protein